MSNNLTSDARPAIPTEIRRQVLVEAGHPSGCGSAQLKHFLEHLIAAEAVIPDRGGDVAPEGFAVEVDVEGRPAECGERVAHRRALVRRVVAFGGAALAWHHRVALAVMAPAGGHREVPARHVAPRPGRQARRRKTPSAGAPRPRRSADSAAPGGRRAPPSRRLSRESGRGRRNTPRPPAQVSRLFPSSPRCGAARRDSQAGLVEIILI